MLACSTFEYWVSIPVLLFLKTNWNVKTFTQISFVALNNYCSPPRPIHLCLAMSAPNINDSNSKQMSSYSRYAEIPNYVY